MANSIDRAIWRFILEQKIEFHEEEIERLKLCYREDACLKGDICHRDNYFFNLSIKDQITYHTNQRELKKQELSKLNK